MRIKTISLFLSIMGIAIATYALTYGTGSSFCTDKALHKAHEVPVLLQDSTLKPLKRHINEVKVATQLLPSLHYKKTSIQDALSARILDNFLKRIDGGKNYFTIEEIQTLKKTYATNVDNMLKSGDLQPIYDIYTCFRDRALTYVAYTDSLLAHNFDFSKNETINLDIDKRNYPQNRAKMLDRWRKNVKNEALNLKLAGKKPADINKTLHKRRKLMRTRILQLNSNDVFDDIMSSLTSAFDPHTGYFSAINAQNFDIEMKKSLEGIGTVLSQDVDYTVITSLVAGGPAFKSKELMPADRILGVAQGNTGEMVDIVGWRLSDVVPLIRGEKGTVVRLLILPAKATPGDAKKEVRLVRDQIDLKSAIASKKVHQITRKERTCRLGVITLPSFYLDWKGKEQKLANYRSSSRDVRRLLEELKAEKVEAILLDLRKNGGGALYEAIAISGLFLSQGPIVQIKNHRKEIFTQADEDPSITYAGPLMILVDRFSASASEILAAAMQDYNRALIVGEPTYGKGTVQNILLLRDYMKKNQRAKTGQLKLTFAKYYRISGKSTQKEGVHPDITFPLQFEPLAYREAKAPAALEWDTTEPIEIPTKENTHLIQDNLRKKLAQNLKTDLKTPHWQKFLEQRKKYQDRKSAMVAYSLNYQQRKVQNDTKTFKNKLLNSKDSLEKDDYLRESLLLLSDMIHFQN